LSFTEFLLFSDWAVGTRKTFFGFSEDLIYMGKALVRVLENEYAKFRDEKVY